jgi:hypothetical protein
LTRHELKEQLSHDQFTDSVANVVNYTATHRNQVIRWVILGLAVLALVVGVLWYNSSRRAARQADLQAALAVVEAPVGANGTSGKTFSTQSEKNKAAEKALSEVMAKNGDSREGMIAQYYLGTLKAQDGDAKSAETNLQKVANSSSEVSSLARIALAELYAGQNRTSEAQTFLRQLINKPDNLVSKSQAELLLAQLLASSNPAESQKLIQGLKKAPGQSQAVTRAADQIAGQSGK